MQQAYLEFTQHLDQFYFDEKQTEENRKHKILKYQSTFQHYSATLEKKYLKNKVPQPSLMRKTMQDVFCCIHRFIDLVIIYMEESCIDYLNKELGISYEQRLSFISSYYDRTRALIKTFKNQNLPKAYDTPNP